MTIAGDDFINILQAAFAPILFHQKLQSQTLTRKSCAKLFHTNKGVCKILMKLSPGDESEDLTTVAIDDSEPVKNYLHRRRVV